MNKLLLSCAALALAGALHAQQDSIFDQGSYRKFNLHLPAGYDVQNEFPIVLNIHGYNSNAAEQQLYSAFDAQADIAGFIVAYPDAIAGTWDFNTDVTFLSNLIDTLRTDYSTNDCLFSTGMSMGGFMSYRMACASPHTFTAIAPVTGNMLSLWQGSCTAPIGLQVMHFHGTADAVVPYAGSPGIPSVESTVQWWAAQNTCDPMPQTTAMPDIAPGDNCTVDHIHYTGCVQSAVVDLYRINGGGHTWPGAIAIPALGNTTQDINASVLIRQFFDEHCSGPSSVPERIDVGQLSLFPNPASDRVRVNLNTGSTSRLSIRDPQGRLCLQEFIKAGTTDLDLSALSPGPYLVRVETAHGPVLTSTLVLAR